MAARMPFTLLTTFVLTALLGCVTEQEPQTASYQVSISQPTDGGVFLDGEYIHIQASVDVDSDQGNDVSGILDSTVVVFYSDVVGVLERETGDCSVWGDGSDSADGGDDDVEDDGENAVDTPCWLVYPTDVAGVRVWSLVTRLPAGSHVIHARAVDTLGGRVDPSEATAVISVKAIAAPEIHLVEPDVEAEIEVGSDFMLEAWISDDIEDQVEVTWSSSLQGIIDESAVAAPGVYEVPCHAGGEAEEEGECHLSTGTHVMVLAAVDDDGWTSHSFLTLRIVPPPPPEEGDTGL